MERFQIFDSLEVKVVLAVCLLIILMRLVFVYIVGPRTQQSLEAAGLKEPGSPLSFKDMVTLKLKERYRNLSDEDKTKVKEFINEN